jgi:hypothetical protein
MRYKAPIRSYCDSGDAMFEVKLKGRRGQTVKSGCPATSSVDES